MWATTCCPGSWNHEWALQPVGQGHLKWPLPIAPAGTQSWASLSHDRAPRKLQDCSQDSITPGLRSAIKHLHPHTLAKWTPSPFPQQPKTLPTSCLPTSPCEASQSTPAPRQTRSQAPSK